MGTQRRMAVPAEPQRHPIPWYTFDNAREKRYEKGAVSSKRGDFAVPWYMIVLLICLVIGPFDALYLYIKAERRRDRLRREREQKARDEEKDKA